MVTLYLTFCSKLCPGESLDFSISMECDVGILLIENKFVCRKITTEPFEQMIIIVSHVNTNMVTIISITWSTAMCNNNNNNTGML